MARARNRQPAEFSVKSFMTVNKTHTPVRPARIHGERAGERQNVRTEGPQRARHLRKPHVVALVIIHECAIFDKI